MDRRRMLASLAAAVATAVVAGCGHGPDRTPGKAAATTPGKGPAVSGTTANPAGTTANPAGTTGPAAPGGVRFAAPTGLVRAPVPRGTLTMLPGTGRSMALTIDDGTDAAVLGAYAELARVTGIRLTFFCNGASPSWTEHAPVLRPLLDQGQIFMANHTWSHPSLLRLSAAELTDQVRRNETFLMNTYGVTGRPFLRPPFGYHNGRVDRQLADLGYPAVTMWYGTLGDATVEAPAKIVSMAKEWFLPQRLVIGHANHRPVTTVLDVLIGLIHERNLQPVHLGDVFAV